MTTTPLCSLNVFFTDKTFFLNFRFVYPEYILTYIHTYIHTYTTCFHRSVHKNKITLLPNNHAGYWPQTVSKAEESFPKADFITSSATKKLLGCTMTGLDREKS
jgi:hypothetical protein